MKKDEVQNMIDRFVETQQAIEPTPFLSTRVMAKLQKPDTSGGYLHPALKFAMITISIISAISGGVLLGSIYCTPPKDRQALVVNDSSIENFGFYYILGE